MLYKLDSTLVLVISSPLNGITLWMMWLHSYSVVSWSVPGFMTGKNRLNKLNAFPSETTIISYTRCIRKELLELNKQTQQ